MVNDRRHLLGGILVATAAWGLWMGFDPTARAQFDEEIEESAPPLDLPAVPASAVVEVMTRGSRGTGFFVSPTGLLVTAEHCVGEARDGERDVLIGYERAGLTLPGRVVARDGLSDLAVVQVELPAFARNASFEYLELETDPQRWLSSVLPDRHVYVRSCPDGNCVPGTFEVHATVSALTTLDVEIWGDPGVVPGMSGGPVIAEDGRVVGVITTGGKLTTYYDGWDDWRTDGGFRSILCVLDLLDVRGGPIEFRVRDEPGSSCGFDNALGLAEWAGRPGAGGAGGEG